MTPERYRQHAIAYGNVVSQSQYGVDKDGNRLTPYTEVQCRACPHENVCCNVIVGATPFEAMGIMAYLAERGPQVLNGMMQAIRLRAAVLDEHFRKFMHLKDGQTKAINAWTEKKLKCVFYDGENKRCGIYPVRPVACRMAFGQGDCNKDGVKGGMTHEAVTAHRALRVRFSKEPQPTMGELTALCVYVTDKQLYMDQETKELLETDPADLTDWQIVFGLRGPQPLPENSNGRP